MCEEVELQQKKHVTFKFFLMNVMYSATHKASCITTSQKSKVTLGLPTFDLAISLNKPLFSSSYNVSSFELTAILDTA